MDKENDIFEQPSKVQNMNYLFEEEEITAPEPKPAQSSLTPSLLQPNTLSLLPPPTTSAQAHQPP